jgi:hypothetical protein
LGQWAIEPRELNRVYPPITDDNDTGNGTGERAVTGGETALVEANARASLLEWRINDLRTILDDMRGQRDDMRGQPAKKLIIGASVLTPVAGRSLPVHRPGKP